jgi:hypothetical protein
VLDSRTLKVLQVLSGALIWQENTIRLFLYYVDKQMPQQIPRFIGPPLKASKNAKTVVFRRGTRGLEVASELLIHDIRARP